METVKVLWIDDKIADYAPFVEGLRARGLAVTPAESAETGVEMARRERDFSLFLIDLRMPERTGFEAITALGRSFPSTPICVLSSYLHVDDYQRRLRRIKRSIGVLAKEIPDPDAPAFDVFADKLRAFVLEPPGLSPRAFEAHKLDQLVDPFGVSFSAYLNLPDRLKDYLRRIVQEQCSSVLAEAFNGGSVWVLMCGDAASPAMVAPTEAKIPNPQDVISKALELDSAPYQFSRPDVVDDCWYGGCRGIAPESDYPTVTLHLGRNASASEHTVHFDTGCPFTVMDYEMLQEHGVLRADSLPSYGSRGKWEYEYVSQPVQMRLCDQENAHVRILEFRVRAVKNWMDSPFVAPCPPTCSRHVEGRCTNCESRAGLVGRNLLSETGVTLILKGRDKKTCIGFDAAPRVDRKRKESHE
jgi:CheY-like chemotaxis protein